MHTFFLLLFFAFHRNITGVKLNSNKSKNSATENKSNYKIKKKKSKELYTTNVMFKE